jgi:hypothetical protein
VANTANLRGDTSAKSTYRGFRSGMTVKAEPVDISNLEASLNSVKSRVESWIGNEAIEPGNTKEQPTHIEFTSEITLVASGKPPFEPRRY